jgi:glucokinase
MATRVEPVVGVDVGASTISVGLVLPDGTVLGAAQAPTDGGEAATDTISRLVDRALGRADQQGLRVAGIGIGLPGLVDVEKGAMRSMDGAWMPELADLPLAALIRARSGHAVFVDNDVNALTLAEWMFGHAVGASSLVTVAIGTGIGAGIVLNGTLVRGHISAAGEIGHMAVSLDGPVCVCGAVGCLGTYLAGRLIPDRARERLDRFPDSAVLGPAGGDPLRISAVAIFAAAAAGDPLARAVVDEACEALAVALGTLTSLLNPEIIVVTGGVASSLAPLKADILARTRRRALTRVLDATAVHVVPADKRSTVRGGAALVLYELSRQDEAPARQPAQA